MRKTVVREQLAEQFTCKVKLLKEGILHANLHLCDSYMHTFAHVHQRANGCDREEGKWVKNFHLATVESVRKRFYCRFLQSSVLFHMICVHVFFAVQNFHLHSRSNISRKVCNVCTRLLGFNSEMFMLRGELCAGF